MFESIKCPDVDNLRPAKSRCCSYQTELKLGAWAFTDAAGASFQQIATNRWCFLHRKIEELQAFT